MIINVSAREVLLSMLPKGGVGAEVGVFEGAFSANILRVAKPGTLHLIDPWVSVDSGPHRESWYGSAHRSQTEMDAIHQRVIHRFDRQIKAGTIVVMRAPSQEALASLPDKSLDWAYIDGDHTYEAVMDDLLNASKKVKAGGLVCGDDYAVPGWWNDGVTRALHDFLHRMGSRAALRFLSESQFVLSVRD